MAASTIMSIDDALKQAQVLQAFSSLAAPQLEQFWKAQDRMLGEAEAYATRWFERRHAAARSALDVAREVNGNGTAAPAAALQALTDWQRRSLERMAEDVQGWVTLCARCSGHLAQAETKGAEEGIAAAEKRVAEAARTRQPSSS